VFVGELVADHHDLPDDIVGVDDAVPGAERTAAAQHRVDGSRDLTPILGMLVPNTNSVVGVTVPGS
jgi:hypothetical protein